MTKIIIESKGHPGSTLMLREDWATGNTTDGRPVEFTRSGASLVLQVGEFGNDRIVETISVNELIVAWLVALGIEKPQGGADDD